ncbi:KDEL motif-containing protein 1, partial [Termitomyces sp. T112]
VGCHEETCLELRRRYEWRRRQGSKESGQFKYIIDVDGNAWSSRFKRLITSNSLVFKATVYPEWLFDRIEPWVHYVPVQVDYSDVYDALAFFRGGLYGEDRREELARTIANEGRAWSRTFWRKEDITAYVYRLILEYARVMSSDRDAMSYDG